MDMVVPDRLRAIAGKLEHFGYKFREESKKRAKGNKDMVAKTQVRFDSRAANLIIAIRRTKEHSWEMYGVKNLPKLPIDDNEPMDGYEQVDDE